MSLNVPLRAEFVSSFVVSAALLCLDVQTELVQRHVVPLFDAFTRAEFDATAVTLTLLFLNLAFVFSPTFVRASKGATNNPTVYLLRMLLGEMNATRAILNATASVLAHACSFAVVMWELRSLQVPWAQYGQWQVMTAVVEEGQRPPLDEVPTPSFDHLTIYGQAECWLLSRAYCCEVGTHRCIGHRVRC